jgi:ribosomal protein L34
MVAQWGVPGLQAAVAVATFLRPRRGGRPKALVRRRIAMKLKIRRSKTKRLKKVGFRTRSKTRGGRKVIKRKIRRSGKFRVG